ncbi:PorV/PorQ family protein [Candidatus Margulisiibacteriota bacterium]
MLRKSTYLWILIVLMVWPLMAGGGSVSDLNKVGVGARVMGMGNTFVGIADDCNSLFSNPAGLGTIGSLELMSMKTSLIGDVDYLVLGGAFPLETGTLGVGYIGANVEDIILVTALNSYSRPVAGDRTSYGEKEFFLGYGVDLLKDIAGMIDLDGSLYLGANAKLYSKEAAGVDQGQGSGFGMDLGLLYAPTDKFSLGISQQNIGSQISWQSGAKDQVEALTKIGLKLQVEKIMLGMDADIAGDDRPIVMHGGAEWWVMPQLAVRGGFDQSVQPKVEGSAAKNTVISNITFGVGLKLWGVSIDYAYHPYYEETDNLTHFMSLSYSQ